MRDLQDELWSKVDTSKIYKVNFYDRDSEDLFEKVCKPTSKTSLRVFNPREDSNEILTPDNSYLLSLKEAEFFQLKTKPITFVDGYTYTVHFFDEDGLVDDEVTGVYNDK